MHQDIVRKLADELNQEIHSERQVIYILVGLRKLLEKLGLLDDRAYRTLRLCCDWSVHPKLSRGAAQEIAILFDRYEIAYRREPIGVSQAGIPELVEFCEHSRFRRQLIAACEVIGLSSRMMAGGGCS